MAEEIKIGTGTTQLRIRWDGDSSVPGLAEHRLSLAKFGEPLALLLAALRRIATQMVSTAVEAERPRFGRFANLARQLDIEVVGIEGNSTGIDAVVSFEQPPDMLPLFSEVAERAVVELLDSIDEERQGGVRNSSVRKYLRSLPQGVHKQLYELHNNGHVKRHVEFGDLAFTDVPPDLPTLIEVEGSVVGVGFEPGRSEVRIKSDVGPPAFDSTDEQVETALQMRKAKIRLLGVTDGKRSRLLQIARARDPRFKVTPEAIEEHIFKRWAGVFEVLSKA
jgi:hypothetical protein